MIGGGSDGRGPGSGGLGSGGDGSGTGVGTGSGTGGTGCPGSGIGSCGAGAGIGSGGVYAVLAFGREFLGGGARWLPLAGASDLVEGCAPPRVDGRAALFLVFHPADARPPPPETRRGRGTARRRSRRLLPNGRTH